MEKTVSGTKVVAEEKRPIPKSLNFLFGGLAGMLAAACCHPLDVLKNRMQLSGKGATSSDIFKTMIKTEGYKSAYKGLTASLLRQATYSSSRLGVYNGLFDFSKGPNGEPPSFAIKSGIGMIAGAAGAFVGTPAEVCLIRMTSDGRLPPAERRNYTHVFNALFRIVKEEGFATLFRGFGPTVARGVVVNGVMLGTYSQAKQVILEKKLLQDGIVAHIAASMFAGLNTAIASLPVDIIKTRVQNMKTVNGVPEYSGSIDALMKTINKEGPFSLWKGFIPYFSRLGPSAILTFVFLEKFYDMYRSSF